MTHHIYIVQGHPDPSDATFCSALADAYSEGASSAMAIVRQADVAKLEFPLLSTKTEWQLGAKGTPKTLSEAQANLIWADHITLIYPLWLGTMPAMLKGLIEQVFRPEIALDYNDQGYPRKLLTGRSARVVVTMGMPVAAYRWYFGAHSLKSLERNILKFCGIKPVYETMFGMVESVDEKTRKKWLDRMRELGRHDAIERRFWTRRLKRQPHPHDSGEYHQDEPRDESAHNAEGAG